MTDRHKVFISYHHNSNEFTWEKKDHDFRNRFEKMCSRAFDIMMSKAVQEGDIPSDSSPDNTHRIIRDRYLRDSTVTVVLIGNDTWRRKHVVSQSFLNRSVNPLENGVKNTSTAICKIFANRTTLKATMFVG